MPWPAFFPQHAAAIPANPLRSLQGERAAETPIELGGRGGEYPCGAAGVNFTHMLIEMLQLRNTEQWPTSAEGIGFAPMLEEAAPVFDELYCAVFAQFDDMWLQYGVAENGAFGHLDFNKIKGALQTRLSTCLKQRPGSFSQLVDSLHHPQA